MISITPAGAIRINREATAALLHTERVSIAYDSETRQIVIAPAGKNDETAFKLRYDPHREGRNAIFSAKAPLLHYVGWQAPEAVRVWVSVNGRSLEGVLPAAHIKKQPKAK